MSTLSLGDLAQSFMLQRRGVALKTEMSRLNAELTSGQVSDVKAVLAGNVSYLSDIENDLRTLAGFRIATSEAAQFADASQIALERIQDTASALGNKVLTGASSAVAQVLDQITVDARNDLDAIVGALNTSQGGRTLFAGTATDTAATVDADTVLSGLRAATATAGTPDELLAAADAWFTDPAGFAAASYLGADETLQPFRLSSTETVTVDITANDAEFRNLLRNVAVAAIVSDSGFGFDDTAKRAVLSEVGNSLFQNQAELTAMRANVGSAQARIDTIATRNAAEETSLGFAKGALLRADPYEAATKLEEVQFQLQSLYAVTARMSDLSLLNFIR